MDPLSTQYSNYNQRRLHYSLLFWACVALQFSGVVLSILFLSNENIVGPNLILLGIGFSCGLMAYIAARLHRLEVHYEILLRRIEEHWQSQNITGIQCAEITQKISSRKLVILTLACMGAGFFGISLLRLF